MPYIETPPRSPSPVAQEDDNNADNTDPINTLPFPPITPTHILNCSFHSWYPRLKGRSPKARLIPLSQPFLDYLRADGIVLPPEATHDGDSGYSDDEGEDISEPWAEIHQQIHDTIAELGGKVTPKLNWSSPKDATWISPTNDMECRTPNEIYLLLKSSDFITHDLEHAFDGCTSTTNPNTNTETEIRQPTIPYHLILRKSFNINPSLEFRVFVRDRRVIAISQREMNHFPFLHSLRNQFKRLIQQNIPSSFPDPNYVFDVYVPPPHEKVWIIDINPWAPRTDPLLFSWLELLTLSTTSLSDGGDLDQHDHDHDDEDEDEGEDEGVSSLGYDPEFRLVGRDDPEAYQFSATKYSAHKLPREVVDAGMTPERMKDMLEEWRRVQEGEDRESESGTGSEGDESESSTDNEDGNENENEESKDREQRGGGEEAQDSRGQNTTSTPL